VILGILLAISLPFGNGQVSAGLLLAALVAITGFAWLQRSSNACWPKPGQTPDALPVRATWFGCLSLGWCLAILIAIVKIHPAGWFAASRGGYKSVWLAFQRAFQ